MAGKASTIVLQAIGNLSYFNNGVTYTNNGHSALTTGNYQEIDNTGLETPYAGISKSEYQIEKRRLQLELLKIQQWVIKNKHRVLVIFEGRDAAGKGSTIRRFTESLIPAHFSVLEILKFCPGI